MGCGGRPWADVSVLPRNESPDVEECETTVRGRIVDEVIRTKAGDVHAMWNVDQPILENRISSEEFVARIPADGGCPIRVRAGCHID